ncbi:MAG: hypothetical protein V2G42_06430 [bacterium JZ-2024 1]
MSPEFIPESPIFRDNPINANGAPGVDVFGMVPTGVAWADLGTVNDPGGNTYTGASGNCRNIYDQRDSMAGDIPAVGNSWDEPPPPDQVCGPAESLTNPWDGTHNDAITNDNCIQFARFT